MTARQAWDQLNERQQAYLTAIYDADQAAEADIADRRRRWQETPPAAEWRWLLYAVKAGGLADDTSIQAILRSQGRLDPGAGSSLAALQRRGLVLVLVRDNIKGTVLGPVPTVEVRLTTAGRAAARAGLGEQPKRAAPAGLLSEWLWRALATLYRASDTGVLYGHHGSHLPRDHPERGPSWNALLQLRNRRDGSYMVEFSVHVPVSGFPGYTRYRARITARGRGHAELHRRCYAELYPDLPAIEPPTPVDGAHAGLADHRTTRPKGLLRGPDWRLLVQLTRMERDNRCPLRAAMAAEYTQWDDPGTRRDPGHPARLAAKPGRRDHPQQRGGRTPARPSGRRPGRDHRRSQPVPLPLAGSAADLGAGLPHRRRPRLHRRAPV